MMMNTTLDDGSPSQTPEWKEPTTFVKKLFELVTKNADPTITPPIISWTNNGTSTLFFRVGQKI
jgi:hypothetical protein